MKRPLVTTIICWFMIIAALVQWAIIYVGLKVSPETNSQGTIQMPLVYIFGAIWPLFGLGCATAVLFRKRIGRTIYATGWPIFFASSLLLVPNPSMHVYTLKVAVFFVSMYGLFYRPASHYLNSSPRQAVNMGVSPNVCKIS